MNEQPSVQSFIDLIKHQDAQALATLYTKSSNNENIAQLKCLYQQAMGEQSRYQFFQDLVTSFFEKKPMPEALIIAISDIDKLTFFTPALSASEGFSLQNEQSNTLLHTLLGHEKCIQPPFNYIRSLLLFERNESLAKALATRNKQQLLPMECYLAFNPCFEPLVDHELTAALALLEAQTKQVPSEISTLSLICNLLKKNTNLNSLNSNNHRILLLGAAFECANEDVMTLLL
ncbi:hypothetical protein PSECIP111951_04049 [Pseudoalteromonas holothuriae]|uniref:Uncharacterized protein n=1 Tax=Pseudoalteromonas holothuriae TaxID=2963714 RepID=A0A9W4R4X6_9GAMM|nr:MULTISPECIES: hypothetical protein [unclassified Pseudoalteromonas]CAH9067028.1 hypothetical protein PSECIP111854_04009 [Pseudoalteromonas sp. CIP111854]CAH9068167.1 hypothetical protein PSECIP111951_04049 [Pseudoalteromonas sp. CIP111951]